MKKENYINVGINTASSLISLIPIVGSPIQAGITSYLNEKKASNIEAFNQELKAELEAIKERLPEKERISENLTEIIESVYDEIQRTNMQKKRAYFAKALANSFLRNENEKMDEEKLFIQILTLVPNEYLNIAIYFKNRSNNDVETKSNKDVEYAAISFFETYGIMKSSGIWFENGSNGDSMKNGEITPLGERFLIFILDVNQK
ncbi:MAG: hypothetical protein ACTIL5_11070 [Lactococcus cremoris]